MMKFVYVLFFFFLWSELAKGQQDYSHLSFVELDSFFYVHMSKGDANAALPFMVSGRKKAKLEFGIMDSMYAEYEGALGAIYTQIGDYENANKSLAEALRVRKEVHGENHLLYLRSLEQFAHIKMEVGKLAEAETLFLEAIQLSEKNGYDDGEDYISYLMSIGALYDRQKKHRLSLEVGLKSHQLIVGFYGENHDFYAQSLANLGASYAQLGDFKKGEEFMLRAHELEQKILPSGHPAIAQGMENLGTLYGEYGQHEKAEQIYLEVLKVKKKLFGVHHIRYSSTLSNLATTYTAMDRLDEAESLFLQAIEIEKKARGTDNFEYAELLNNLANLYLGVMELQKAEALYLEALDVVERSVGKNNVNYATTMSSLIDIYIHSNRMQEAEKMCKEAIQMAETYFPEHRAYILVAYRNLGKVYRYQGHYEKAITEFKSVEKQIAAYLGIGHLERMSCLKNLALIYLETERVDEAMEVFERMIKGITGQDLGIKVTEEWANQVLSKVNPSSEIGGYVNLVLFELYHLTDSEKEQLILAKLAVNVLKKIRDTQSAKGDKMRLLKVNSNWVLKSLDLLSNYDDTNKATYLNEAFQFAEQSKSVLLMDALQTEDAHQFGDLPDSLVMKELYIQKEKAKLEAKLLENHPLATLDSIRNDLNSLKIDMKRFKDFVEAKFPHYASLKYEQEEASIAKVQAQLDDKSALIEYVIGDSVIYIFYVDQKKSELLAVGVNNKELQDKIKKLHNNLSSIKHVLEQPELAYRNYTATAHWFYKQLLEPVLPKDNGIEHLIIITDQELGHLPFETFLIEGAPQAQIPYGELHFLMKDYSVSYDYSALMWQENNTKSNKEGRISNGQMLAVAADYAIRDSSNIQLPLYQKMRKGLNPLPAAEQEVTILSQYFEGNFVQGKAASERNFKQDAGNYQFIHLAMHGLLNQNAPNLSSLAFTETGDSIENDFLQVYEISKMKLNADLVILSACETGFGKFETGNGIASLARSFMYAGVPSMVVSLWQVNDAATSEIMRVFYENLAKGMKKSEALRQSKLAFIEQVSAEYAHPSLWSPFIVLGNDSPVTIARKGSMSTMLYWIGGLVLLMVGGVFLYKKNRSLT